MKQALNWWQDGAALGPSLAEALAAAVPGPGPLRPALQELICRRRLSPQSAATLDALGLPTFGGFIALVRLWRALPGCELPARGVAPELTAPQLAALATRACASAVGGAALWQELSGSPEGGRAPGLARALAHGAALAVAERVAPPRGAGDALLPARRLCLELLSRGRAKPEALAAMGKGERLWLAWRLESVLPWVLALAPASRQGMVHQLLPAAVGALRAAQPLALEAFDARLRAAVGGARGTRPLG